MNCLLRLLFTLVLISAPALAVPRFPGARGDYGGIVEADPGTTGADAAEASGAMRVILTDSGEATVRLIWRNQSYVFKSRFAQDPPGQANLGSLTRSFPKKGLDAGATPETLLLDLKLTVDVRTIAVTLTEQPEGGSAGTPVAFVLSGAVADPLLLQQLAPGLPVSFIDPPTTMSPREAAAGTSVDPAVEGDGFAVIALGKSARRNGRFVGRLPDSEAFSSGSPLRSTSYVVRSPLYRARRFTPGGQVLGNATATTSSSALNETRGITGTGAQLDAALRWYKKQQSPSTPTYNAYKNGFDHRLQLDGQAYKFGTGEDRRLVPIGLNTSGPRSLANATITVRNGNFGTPIQIPVNISFLGALVLQPNPIGLRMSVDALRGRFKGSFKHPAHPPEAPRVKFSGAFQSKLGATPGEGKGNFLSVPNRDDATQSRSGTVRISVQ